VQIEILVLAGDERCERRALSEIDAERALISHMGESYFERARGLAYLIGLHRGASEVLLFVVSGTRSHVLVDGEAPLIFGGDGVDAISADWNCRAGETELGFGEKSHGRAAGCPGLAVRDFVALGCCRVVAYVDLAAIVQITTRSGRGARLLSRANSNERGQDKEDYERAEHGSPFLRQKCSAETS